MKEPIISKIYIDEKMQNKALAKNYQSHNPDADISIIEVNQAVKDELFNHTIHEGKRELLLTEKEGHTVKQCPGTDRIYRCCNYHVINQTTNCPIDCTYCILQFYLNNPVTTVYADSKKIFKEVSEKIATQPRRFFRIGTGELSDSLAFDSSSEFSKEIIEAFAHLPNVLLELKTKSNKIDNVIGLDHKGHTVISWSVNPQSIITKEEHKAATLKERLEAASKVQADGYKIGLHFDPILYHEHWEINYTELIQQIFDVIHPKNIAWISMGSLRFPPDMKEKVLEKFPKSKIMFAELIHGMDGKMRYPKPLRLEMYHHIYSELKKYGSDDLFIYFCMESEEIWNRVMGWSPDSNEDLDYLFARNLYKQFPGLMDKPEKQIYENGIPLHHEKASFDKPAF
jgi:spore photoproduct lyase